jgi:hypothetical protein
VERKEASGMSNLAEKSERSPFTTETEEQRWELFENWDARLRDQKHLEMAYEWLRSRGKTGLLKGSTENT